MPLLLREVWTWREQDQHGSFSLLLVEVIPDKISP